MKSILKSINKFIKNHKILSVIIGIAILLLIFGIIIYNYLFSMNGNQYGNRLKGIENVKISNVDASKLEEELNKKEEVKTAKYDLKGKIINLIVDVKKGTSKDTSKALSTTIKDFFDEKEIGYYDFQIFVKCSECDATDNTYPIIGYKNNSNNDFVWTNN